MKKTDLKPASTKATKSNKLGLIVVGVVIVVLILSYLIIIYFAQVKVAASPSQINLPQNTETKIIWPSYGQSAVGAVGYGVLATDGAQSVHPIASIAKLVLAMAVLNEKPLKTGEAGPVVVMGQTDVDFYYADLKQGGSLLPVDDGEKLTEYQLLQGLLIASGDNIAETLATWAFGSTENYLAYANQMVAKMNLTQTHIADDSGLSAQTVSSALDLVKLGEKALSYPVLAEIVSQPKATFPVGGTLTNYNSILGMDGIIGIKTGNTDEAGGCFLFAVKNTTDATMPIVIGAILGAKNLGAVLRDTTAFIQANLKNFKTVPVLQAGQTIGIYDTPWGQKINAVTTDDLVLYSVDNKKITPNISL
ncbi:MAG: hypothetical protein Q7S80_02875, partial [bacterium]|nr:hypothetical protein [bacterium]